MDLSTKWKILLWESRRRKSCSIDGDQSTCVEFQEAERGRAAFFYCRDRKLVGQISYRAMSSSMVPTSNACLSGT